MKLGCVIMAAGASGRFGKNKLLQNVSGKPMYAYVQEAVQGIFDKTVVVTGYEPVKEYAEKLGFLPVENKQPELGISHTIRLGLEALKDCDGAVFTTADQPFLKAETFLRLKEAFCREPTVLYTVTNGEGTGNPCLFPKEFFRELEGLQGDTGGKKVLLRHKDRLRVLYVNEKELLDCDTPQELQEYTKKLS